MTRDELKGKLQSLESGRRFGLSYAMFELIFPPGIEDDNTKVQRYEFAKENGCYIENLQTIKIVNFVKGQPPTVV